MVKLPVDEVLAAILEKCKKEIFKYHEHQNLLENRPEEQLNPEEQKLAWDEFRKEQEAAYQRKLNINCLYGHLDGRGWGQGRVGKMHYVLLKTPPSVYSSPEQGLVIFNFLTFGSSGWSEKRKPST